MILSGKEILKHMGGDIKIEPFDPSLINPNSCNLRLNNELLVYDADILDMKVENLVKTVIIPDDGLLILPLMAISFSAPFS